jgi:hypothetical protein
MDVSADGNWRVDPCEIGLSGEDFLGLIAKHLHAALLDEFIILDLLQDVLHCF